MIQPESILRLASSPMTHLFEMSMNTDLPKEAFFESHSPVHSKATTAFIKRHSGNLECFSSGRLYFSRALGSPKRLKKELTRLTTE